MQYSGETDESQQLEVGNTWSKPQLFSLSRLFDRQGFRGFGLPSCHTQHADCFVHLRQLVECLPTSMSA